jgi:hypothetical protein
MLAVAPKRGAMMDLDANGVRGVLQEAEGIWVTNGDGDLIRVEGEGPSDEELAPQLDIVLSAIQSLGKRQSNGALDLALFSFSERSVIVAVHPSGGHVAVVAPTSVKPGLLLNYVRRLIGTETAKA